MLLRVYIHDLSIVVKRIGFHFLFWLVYLLWSGYVSGSYDDNFYRAFMSDLAHLPLKIAVTYFLMYFMLPLYMRKKKYGRLVFIALSLLVTTALLHRLIIYKITWPLYYPESTFYFWNFPRLLTGVFDVFSIAGIAAGIKLFRTRMETQQREEKLLREKAETELRFLRAQMNPHFLFNTLTSIYALSRMQSPFTSDAVMRLSKILRYTLYSTQKQTSTLEDELKVIDDYVQLQQLRFGSKVQFTNKHDIDDVNTPIAQLLLLPLVENAFKHGTGNNIDGSKISFDLKLKNAQLQLRIENSVEEDSDDSIKTEGIGLVNIQRQLKLLYSDYLFGYDKSEKAFTVNLQINLKSYLGHELSYSGR